jgi:hypothetical protein
MKFASVFEGFKVYLSISLLEIEEGYNYAYSLRVGGEDLTFYL